MELKNAVAVCLISMFSATLVVLIARVSGQPGRFTIGTAIGADRRRTSTRSALKVALLPHRAARSGGNSWKTVWWSITSTATFVAQPAGRSNRKRTTTVQNDFAAQLDSGKMAWKILNYEKPEVGRSRQEVRCPHGQRRARTDGRRRDRRTGNVSTRSGRWWVTSRLLPSSSEQRSARC